MRWWVTVPLLVVVVAGCSGLSAPGGVASETGTLTPVSVPAQPTPVGGTPWSATPANQLAPGLTTAGVTDPFALADAHHDELANRSFTRITHTTLAGPNGTLRVTHEVLRVAAGGRAYHLTATSESAESYPVSAFAPHLELWYADGPALFRVGEGEHVSYRVGTTGTLDGPVGDISGRDRLVGLYGTVDDWSVQPRIGWDDPRFVLASREPPDDDVLRLPTLVEDPRNAELEIVTTGDGRVVTQRLRYDATFDGQPVQIVRRVRFVKVGTTTVAEPAWLDEARRETVDDRRGSG
jgi:hypothetical protein